MTRLRGLMLLLVAMPAAAAAQPLTIRVGESWAFAVEKGQPVRAHRVKAAAKPARGEIKAILISVAGTTMTLTNNSATSYTYRADLIGSSSKRSSRTCTLPADLQPSLEYWPLKAVAVRLGDFRATDKSGNCPPGS